MTGTDDPHLRLLQPLSNGASDAQVLAQLRALRERAAFLPEIEQAKGALMLAYGLTADEAFALLRRCSQNRNVKIRDIAARLVGNLDAGPRDVAVARHMDRHLDDATSPTPRPRHAPVPDGGGTGSGHAPTFPRPHRPRMAAERGAGPPDPAESFAYPDPLIDLTDPRGSFGMTDEGA